MGDDNNTKPSGNGSQDVAERPLSAFEHTRPRRGLPDAEAFLRAVVKLGASDLHLKSGQRARVRINGQIRTVEQEAMPTEEFETRLFRFLSEEERRKLITSGSVDFAYDLDGEVRFRINVFKHESGLSLAARVVPRQIPSFEDLHLPPVVSKIADFKDGLVLVSGTTGSGKSTTLAAILEQINCTRQEHIITIEDPIEFLYDSKRCLIHQREVGINVKDFPTALRALMREDPDVILIGEMRDAETVRAALQAADTGHLVFGIVHASNAPQSIERILNLFDENERPGLRQSLANNIRAIVCQMLMKSSVEKVKRVPAVEVLISTPIVHKLISENNDAKLFDVIRTGDQGMLGFSESLYMLYKQELIDRETGHQIAPNPEEFEMLVRGIKLSHPGIVG